MVDFNKLEDTKVFELFPVQYGCGTHPYTGYHVRLREWIKPNGFEDKDGVICLTCDAEDATEFCHHIDELIEDLEKLKAVARRKIYEA
ncbi:hypothetical protein [Parasphingorhabdus halotolerans]|uniref:Uncharacterized protein n=1 Tax=Parasphingorhabdus halotolerans TaxID=2725558 RepID=A0A6H2DKU8_9SPHN|nr:hypothetical protein [Parasphingorhabdus halotolerans]QJB68974.1 hypothetical protein HF685_06520 [Parasphingorhabdus halotolerans]